MTRPKPLFLTALLFLALLPFFPAALPAATSFNVGTVENLVLKDSSRSREVPVKIYYPQSRDPKLKFPVVVFSHGAGGSKDGYAYLGKYWAAAGYVCIHPEHFGSDKAIIKKGRLLLSLMNIKRSVEDPKNLVNRPLDISFILDSLPKIEKTVPALKGRLDTSRIGVAGHSFGAYTTMALAGAVIHLSKTETRDFSDKRVSAFIAMSPQGKGSIGFQEGSWARITRPVLTMTGTNDEELGGKDPSVRLEPFQGMPPGDKFLILIDGGTHMDFSDRQLDGKPVKSGIHEMIEGAGLAFWDAYLGKAGGFEKALPVSGGTLTVGGAKAKFQKK